MSNIVYVAKGTYFIGNFIFIPVNMLQQNYHIEMGFSKSTKYSVEKVTHPNHDKAQ